MIDKENFYTALTVTAIGLIVFLMIPIEVSMDAVPGSMGFSQVGPATLPRSAAWGFTLTGLTWLTFEIRKYLKARGAQKPAAEPIQAAAEPNQRDGWTASMLVWVGMLAFTALTPVLGYAEACMVFGLPLGLAIAYTRQKRPQPSDFIVLLAGIVITPLLLHFLFYRFLYVAFPVGPISRLLIGE